MSALELGVVRRRLRGKQPAEGGAVAVGQAAVHHDMCTADGLIALPLDGRRRHVHYTHVRTTSPQDVQPESLTRKQFWEHLLRCYQEAYPTADSSTGCILQFGMVCKEKHHDATRFADRSEHHHAATYSSLSHFWRRVRKISADKYHIQLNAVAHDAYSTMYRYLREPSEKKPVQELDATPYHSSQHPAGDALRELLAQGERYAMVRRQIGKRQRGAGGGPLFRSQFGLAFNWIIDHGLRKRKGALQLEIDAVQELKAGRPQLLDFVKKFRGGLEDQVEYCWSLVEAPERLERLAKTRLEILLDAAMSTSGACANESGRCASTYRSIVTHQGVDPADFCHLLFAALEAGRRKGSAVMIVGVGTPARLPSPSQPG